MFHQFVDNLPKSLDKTTCKFVLNKTCIGTNHTFTIDSRNINRFLTNKRRE